MCNGVSTHTRHAEPDAGIPHSSMTAEGEDRTIAATSTRYRTITVVHPQLGTRNTSPLSCSCPAMKELAGHQPQQGHPSTCQSPDHVPQQLLGPPFEHQASPPAHAHPALCRISAGPISFTHCHCSLRTSDLLRYAIVAFSDVRCLKVVHTSVSQHQHHQSQAGMWSLAGKALRPQLQCGRASAEPCPEHPPLCQYEAVGSPERRMQSGSPRCMGHPYMPGNAGAYLHAMEIVLILGV